MEYPKICSANALACSNPAALPPEFPIYAITTLAGTLLGATIGIRYLPVTWIQAVLGMVLSIAGAKLLFW